MAGKPEASSCTDCYEAREGRRTYIRLCPLHAAAGEMRDMLRHTAARINELQGWTDADPVWKEARALLDRFPARATLEGE